MASSDRDLEAKEMMGDLSQVRGLSRTHRGRGSFTRRRHPPIQAIDAHYDQIRTKAITATTAAKRWGQLGARTAELADFMAESGNCPRKWKKWQKCDIAAACKRACNFFLWRRFLCWTKIRQRPPRNYQLSFLLLLLQRKNAPYRATLKDGNLWFCSRTCSGASQTNYSADASQKSRRFVCANHSRDFLRHKFLRSTTKEVPRVHLPSRYLDEYLGFNTSVKVDCGCCNSQQDMTRDFCRSFCVMLDKGTKYSDEREVWSG